MCDAKSPVFVGVTGHRNIVDEDRLALKQQVVASLREILALSAGEDGERAPVVMLNGLAQGADMLCAEAAFEVGIDVWAVLPREEEEYLRSFDDETDRRKLHGYLERAKRVIFAPDIEQKREWLMAQGVDAESYEYRQLGIYIAERAHVLIALWDGKPPKTQYGCGTAEVIGFALEHNELGGPECARRASTDRMGGAAVWINTRRQGDGAAVWINTRRQGDGAAPDVRRTWMSCSPANGKRADGYVFSSEPPDFLRKTLRQSR